MKLIEVVILTGVHCVSPTQNTSLTTEVSKVWCAVIIESDAATNSIEVTPRSQADHPMVKPVLSRIVAAWTPPAKRGLLQSGLKATNPAPEALTSSVRPILPQGQNRKTATLIVKTLPPMPEQETPVPASANDDPPDDANQPAQTETVTVEEKAAEAEAKTAALVEEPPKKPAKKSAKKRSDVCRGGTKAVWYTNNEGRRKYRCRKIADLKLY